MWRLCGSFVALLGLSACHPNVVRPFDAPPTALRTTAQDRAAVVQQDNLHFSLLDPGDPAAGYRATHSFRAVITGPSGLELGRGRVFIPGDGTLVAVRARSWRPDAPNDVSELEPYAVSFQAVTEMAGMLYGSSRVAHFDVPGVQVGDVIEYETVLEVRGSASLPPWIFGGSYFTELSSLTVDVPDGQELHSVTLKAGQVAELKPSRTVNPGGGERWRWSQENLPPSRATSREDPRAITWLSWRTVYPDWDAVGAWYRTLSEGLDELSESEVPVLVDPTGDPRRDWYDFVRDGVRYLAYYAEGIDGYRAHAAEDVLRGRFGDCKDMATLLLALYRHAGVEAYPVLARLDGTWALAPLPTPAVFNHALVALPRAEGGYLFLDPTDKLGAFGEIRPELVGRKLFVVRPDGASLMEVPPPAPEENRSALTWTLEPDGGAHLTAELSGTEARWVRAILREWGDVALAPAVRSHLLGAWPGAEVRALELAHTQDGLRLEVEVKGPPAGWSGGDLTVIPLARFFDRAPEDPSVPGLRETTLELAAVSGESVALPASISGEDESLEVEADGARVVLRHRVRWRTEAAGRAVPRVAREALVLGAGGRP
ncbi:MAG: DUF3857 domain-containing protein [Deltaproteobacteria bacterium]|nr:DUF3857 domain-containing protein [Deltaproteobacteria bacterium]